ncbi:MAG: hypothetical protein ACYS22_14670 [Planctomycetota bacterium]
MRISFGGREPSFVRHLVRRVAGLREVEDRRSNLLHLAWVDAIARRVEQVLDLVGVEVTIGCRFPKRTADAREAVLGCDLPCRGRVRGSSRAVGRACEFGLRRLIEQG